MWVLIMMPPEGYVGGTAEDTIGAVLGPYKVAADAHAEGDCRVHDGEGWGYVVRELGEEMLIVKTGDDPEVN